MTKTKDCSDFREELKEEEAAPMRIECALRGVVTLFALYHYRIDRPCLAIQEYSLMYTRLRMEGSNSQWIHVSEIDGYYIRPGC
jgi:hypothetical protein